jgi:hypothetical protein
VGLHEAHNNRSSKSNAPPPFRGAQHIVRIFIFDTHIEIAAVAQSIQWLEYGLDDWGSIPGWGCDFFILPTASRPALRPTHGVISAGVKLSGREIEHLHLVPSLRMRGAIPPLLEYLFMA